MKTLLLVLFISFCGCRSIINLVSDTHSPKHEDKESLIKYLNKKNICTDNILVFADSVDFYKRISGGMDLPNIQVFNKEGFLIYHKDTAITCNGSNDGFTKMICMVSNLKQNKNKKINTVTDGLITLENVPVKIKIDNEYDYYVFIYWARFLGIANKVDVKVWENNLQRITGCKVCIYKINMDWQKRWYHE